MAGLYILACYTCINTIFLIQGLVTKLEIGVVQVFLNIFNFWYIVHESEAYTKCTTQRHGFKAMVYAYIILKIHFFAKEYTFNTVL